MEIENSYSKYLKAFALFSLAQESQSKVDFFESEIIKTFNGDNGSHLSDAVYELDSKGDIKFNEALLKLGYQAPSPPKNVKEK